MPRQPGSKLGHYEIISPLPGSGAGETYKAADTELNRTVTITVLPVALVRNSDLTQRLEREAQTLASLKHPNIGAVYGIGRDEDTQFVVAEYVEGQTLADRLSGKPLEWNEAVSIAIAMADALDKAHRKGVTHRALSPSNVIVTQSGAKLLDFGLSAMAETGPPAELDSMATTRTAPLPATAAPGALLPYRSPEQLSGKDGDVRSDIFALGAILYEMVTGKRAFEGKTQALVIAAIDTIDPDPVSKSRPDAPPAVDYIVAGCLAKNPKQRIQTAWDLLCQLQWIAEGGGSAGVPAPWARHWKKRGRIYRIALAVAASLAAAVAPAAWLGNRSTPEAPDVRFMIANMGFTAPNGTSTSIGMSPNGRWLVTSQGVAGRGLDAFAFGSPGRQVLLGEDVPYLPFWRPDTEEIAFFEEGNLKKARVSGGPSQNLCPAPPPWGGGTWSSRGVIVFSSEGGLKRVLDGGGPPETITALDKSQQETEHLAPFFLPDGRHYLFLALSAQREKSAIYLGSLDSNQRSRLFTGDARTIFVEPGYLLYNRGDAIFARAFDREKLTLQGAEMRVVDGVPTLAVIAGGPTSLGLGPSGVFAASQTGTLAYRIGGPNLAARGGRGTVGNATDMTLVLFDRASRTPMGPPGPYAGVDLAPDGKRFAVHRHDGDGGDIWLYDADQGRMLRWTDDPTQENSSPVWSPDGKRIAFASLRNGKWGIYVRVVDKSAKEEPIVETGIPAAPMNWTNSDQLVYWVADPKTNGDIWAVSVTGDHKPVPIVQTANDERFPQVSPDGRWIAYMATDAMATNQIFIDDFPKGPGHWQITNEGGTFPRWGADGKELFFYRNNTMWSVDIHVTGSSITPGAPRELFPLGSVSLNSSHIAPSYLRYAVSKDGQRFLIPQVTGTANTTARGTSGAQANTLAEALAASVDGPRGGATPAGTGNDIAVVLNWMRMLKAK